MIFKFDDSQALQQFNQYNRKDSGSSEVAAFLNPSGRTSRISSVGSQGSAVSRLSGASGISRSPSPHKMLVETSFCGPKPIEPSSDASSIEQLTADMLENVILARRGDPTKVSLAQGHEIKDDSASRPAIKTTKEKLEEISMTPAEAARAAAKEARKKEIEALKARLNAINAKQLEKAKGGGVVAKKVIGVTPEGTEYTRIKLKPDHLYDDNGMSPNERIIEEKDFKEQTSRREKSRKDAKGDNTINQITRISPTTHATDNRSPSPASTSVSRKSSFCSFFKSKETSNESSSKPRSSSAASGKGRLNDKSPLPSPSKSSNFSSRIAFSLFKSNRNMSPSQIESHDGINMKPITQQHQSRHVLKDKDIPKLKYYDAPDVIHIPLHTPPEEKEFSALKKKKEDVEEKTATPVVAPVKQEIIQVKPKVAPTAQVEKMYSTDEIELHEMPNRKASSDEREGAGSSIWSVEVQRHSSQESQETVISSQQKNDNSPKPGTTDKPAIPTFIDTINESSSTTSQEQPPPMSAKGRHKKHILFSTKIGSGSEEQVFCTQLSLSKTESQSSQLSEQASVYESPKNEECGTKVQETVTRNNLKHQSSSEVEKVTATSARSRRSDQSDSADSRPQSVTKKQRESMELLKKRESSDEVLHKKRDSSEHKGHSSQSSHSNHSPISPIASTHSQSSLKKNEKQPSLQHQSSGSKMEISSESDRESDIDGCVNKRVSRIMEDHESAGLVLQESFDDELPYVPTTLPEERSCGLRIVPTKDRTQNELITIPVERPRSTTPINPASLDNYCERKPSDASECSLVRGEKLRISLPKQKAEQTKEKIPPKVIIRRISNLSNKSWTEFAEQQQTSSTPAAKKVEKSRKQSNSSQDEDPPPPPPSKSHSKKSLTNKWIDFENIPEKRQPPKKITTIPSNKEPAGEKNHKHHHHHHHRQYVSPEECQCECHESLTKKEPDNSKQSPGDSGKTPNSSEDSQPLLDEHAERHSLMR